MSDGSDSYPGSDGNPLVDYACFAEASTDELVDALVRQPSMAHLVEQYGEESVRFALSSDGYIHGGEGNIYLHTSHRTISRHTAIKATLDEIGYSSYSTDAQAILFSIVSTQQLIQVGANPTEYILPRYGLDTPFGSQPYPSSIPGREKVHYNIGRKAFGPDREAYRQRIPNEYSDITYDLFIDLSEHLETDALTEIAENFGVNIRELDDGYGRTEVHLQTSLGFNLVHIEDNNGTRLIAYKDTPEDEELMFAPEPDKLNLDLEDILSGGTEDQPLTVDWDKLMLRVPDQPADDWRRLPPGLTLDQIRLVASLPPGTVIETERNDALEAVTAARVLIDSEGRIRPRMSHEPPLHNRISMAGHHVKLPTKKELDVDRHYGTFDKYRILLLAPNEKAVQEDMSKTVQWETYDPDTIVSVFIGLPLKHSGKGVVGIATTSITTYTRHKTVSRGEDKGTYCRSERRTALRKAKRANDQLSVLEQIRNESAATAIALERAGIRHPMLAGLPTLGKRR